MKIRGFIISGVILLGIGAGITGYAATRNDFDYDELTNPEYEIESKSFSVEEVTSGIFIDIDAENISIVTHDSNEIDFTYKKNKFLDYTFTVSENQALEIEQHYKGKWYDYIFFNMLSLPNRLNEPLVLTLPMDYEEEITLNLKAGNAKITNVALDVLNLNVDAGNIEILDSTIQKITLDLSAGNFKSNNMIVNEIRVDLNAGNVNFDGRIIELGTFEISAGNANLKLIGSEEDYMINGKGNGSSKILSDVSAGNFKYSFKE